MEINITAWLANNPDFSQYSGSVAEQGEGVGQRTWANAVQRAAYGTPLLNTPDKLEAMRVWSILSGGWEAYEVAAWSDVELNALFIQLVSGDMREKGADTTWAEYQAEREAGQVSGSLFEADGQVYYQLEG